MGAQPPKPPPKPPAQAPRATLMGIPTVNPGAAPNLAGAQATFSPPVAPNPHEQRTVEMQAPVIPAQKAPEPPRPTAMGIPSVDISKLTPADARKPAASPFGGSEERTQVEMAPPGSVGRAEPPRPTAMGIPIVPSTPSPVVDRQPPPGPTAMGIPTVQPTRPQPTPPQVVAPVRPMAPPAPMPVPPPVAAITAVTPLPGKLRPSLIPHAPTPQPRTPDNDFESEEATRKVDMAIPRQARRDPLATVKTMDAVAEAVLPKVMEAAAPRIADAVANAGARGPEYEAIAKLSREVIEQVVWEVVPDLAEAIIKAELDRLVKERKSAS
jgi:hypothetical protein